MQRIEQYHIGVASIEGIDRLVLAFVADERCPPQFTPPHMTLSWSVNGDGLVVQDLTNSHCWLFVVPSQYSQSSCEDVAHLIEQYGDLYVAAINEQQQVLSSACFQIA